MTTKHIVKHSTSEKCTATLIRPLSPSISRIRLSVPLPSVKKRSPLLESFLAHMLTRGSKRYSKDQYEEALASLGAQFDISADAGHIHLSLTVHNSSLRKVLEIVDATLREPLFLKTEITKLKKETEQMLRELRDDTRYRASTLYTRLLYKKGDHRHIPELKEQERYLAELTHADLMWAHAELLSGKWYVTVSGPHTSLTALVKLVEKYTKKHTPTYFTPEPHLSTKTLKACDFVKGKQNVELFMGSALPLLPGTPEYTAFSFGIDVLGKRGGFAGRLMSTVREKEGLTYGIYAWLGGNNALFPGHYTIGTFFTPKDLKQGISSTLREVERIKRHGVHAKEVVQFKKLLLNQFALAFESGETMVSMYHNAIVSNFGPDFVDKYPGRIEAVTAQDVSRVLGEYLDTTRLVMAGSGSIKTLPPQQSLS